MASGPVIEFTKKIFPATQTALLEEPSGNHKLISACQAIRKSPGIVHVREVLERSRSSFDDVLRDDQSHYFRGSLADRVEPRISPVPVHIELVCVTISSVYLNRLVADSQPVLARKDFRLGRFRFERFSSVLQVCGSVDHHSRR